MRNRWRWAVAGGLAALLVLGLAPTAWVWAATSGLRYQVADAPDRPVAIVLGAGVRPDGVPTRVLRARLDRALELYEAGSVRAILVTGDNSRENYNETDAMRAYLLARGVPEQLVVGDYAGFSTWDSCVRAREVFGVTAAAVVTQDFHVPRAVALCRAAGIDAVGVADPYRTPTGIGVVTAHLREVAANVPAAFSAAFRPDPRFLGPREPGIEEALAGSGTG
ncbi:SanA/YdcF family protein [Allonocardiopsis opalescens]|uniref:Vancomycin permeability regulator SanA n=1 Tax=Allonocardiopsis opalescens TaxID=1144618 RepID=A0A2T0Q9I8_9ACTN|nr:ElyC/SanA/YdcF family protein [Allonocardiopsis opalescens]PRY00556.1 vancomycin permeability regulator SanA [Allonocardiopsis opalescens]